MSRHSAIGVGLAALLAVMSPSATHAVTFDKLAYLTFSGPVQVPGAMLNAGTYRFRLTNPDTSRNVLQVLSHDGGIVYAMFHTIPDGRMSLTADPSVTFKEVPVGVTPALKSLFYGGEYRGYEFIYPRGGPDMTVYEAPQPEITYTPNVAAPVFEPAIEVEAVEEPVAEPVWEQAAVPAAPAEPVELPRTATPLPFIAVSGLASLVAGIGLRRLRRRVN